jgi:hypothetical protein
VCVCVRVRVAMPAEDIIFSRGERRSWDWSDTPLALYGVVHRCGAVRCRFVQ